MTSPISANAIRTVVQAVRRRAAIPDTNTRHLHDEIIDLRRSQQRPFRGKSVRIVILEIGERSGSAKIMFDSVHGLLKEAFKLPVVSVGFAEITKIGGLS
jgi:hypothetical protein